MWSECYNKCTSCNKTEIRYCAKGLCEKCYKLEYHNRHKGICSICDKVKSISKIEGNKIICKTCYKKYFFKIKPKICGICNKLGRIDKTDGEKLICSYCYKKHYLKIKINVCSICNKLRSRYGFKDGKPICGFCYRRFICIRKKEVCDKCKSMGVIHKILSDNQRICYSCYKKMRRDYYLALNHMRRVRYIGKLSEIDLIKIRERDKVCVYCGNNQNLCFDHIVPVSKGGKSEFNNLVLACRKCNISKRNNDVYEWCENRGIKIPDLILKRAIAGN